MRIRKMWKQIGLLAVVVSLVISGSGFAATKTANFNEGKTMIADKIVENMNMVNKVKVGKQISVVVDENVTTGYEWSIKVTGEPKSVKTSFVEAENKDKEPVIEGKPLICGAGMKKELIVKGVKKGQAVITMTYARPFEKNVEPIKTMVFVVNVE